MQAPNLALAFQEVLTAIERIRAHRQKVTNADAFRADMRETLKLADQEARSRGYSPEDVRLAAFAVVAFLDESILNSQDPVFGDWPRKPLQQEIFGGHQAGEIYFQNIERLSAQPDSAVLADIMEVYLLCVLLGYGGRYSLTGRSELRAITDSLTARIRRIRGGTGPLSPSWAPQTGIVAPDRSDPWIRRLAIAAGICVGVALVLFVILKLTLDSGVSGL